MLKAVPKLQTKTVWAGIYGWHIDVIVLFSKKPKRTTKKQLEKKFYLLDGTFENGIYEPLDQQDIIVGDLHPEMFEELFQVDLSPYLTDERRPKSIKIVEVFKIELTAIFDEDGKLPTFHYDWR